MPERSGIGARHIGTALGALAVLAVGVSVLLVSLAGTGPAPSPTASAGRAIPGTPPESLESPPPDGPATPELHIVAMGDSVPTASTCGCTGYVELLGRRLGGLTGRSAVVHNDATDGWTTADVVADLDAGPTRADLVDADLVVVEIGANDFDFSRVDDPSCYPAPASTCWASTIESLKAGLAQIVGTVKSIDTDPAMRVAVVGYWNVTVDGAVGRARGQDFVEGSDSLTRAVNAAIAGVAQASGAIYVDAYTPLKGPSGDRDPTSELLADGDHPNQAGHQRLMQAVLSALLQEGAVESWTR
jgi:lysophospholipase L1-like esterase